MFKATPVFSAVVKPDRRPSRPEKAIIGQQDAKGSLVGSKTPFLSSRKVGSM
jgi:hypothetical protein